MARKRQRVMSELDEETRVALDRWADGQNRSRSAQIERYVEQGLLADGFTRNADRTWNAPEGAPWRPPVHT